MGFVLCSVVILKQRTIHCCQVELGFNSKYTFALLISRLKHVQITLLTEPVLDCYYLVAFWDILRMCVCVLQ